MNSRDIYVYISGPFTNKDKKKELKNIKNAYNVLIKLIQLGFVPICPITMTVYPDPNEEAGFSYTDIGYNNFLNYDIKLLKLCDCIYMLPGWQKSKGAIEERNFAVENNIRVFYTMEDLILYSIKNSAE